MADYDQQQSQAAAPDDPLAAPAYVDETGQGYSPNPYYVATGESGPPAAVSAADLDAAHGHYADTGSERAPVQGGRGYSNLDNDGTGAGPYAQVYSRGDERGGGVGLYDGPTSSGDNLSVLSANAHWGSWKDARGGDVSGADANAQVLKFSTNRKSSPINGDMGILDANDTMIDGDNETSIGAGANIVDVAGTVGSEDNNVRAGVSMGVGLGARYHHSLDPATNKRSYGIGVDFGPVSFDARTDAFSSEELGPTEEGKMVNPEDADEDTGPRFYAGS